MDSLIRPLHPGDARTLALIEATTWRHAYGGLLPTAVLQQLQPERLQRRWRQRLQGEPAGTWGIEVEELLVGYCTAVPARDSDLPPGFAGEVAELYVHPGWQGQRLGLALLDHALQAMTAAGLDWAVLWVLEDNTPARAFYAAAGLQPDGQRRRVTMAGSHLYTLRYARSLRPVDLHDLLTEGAGR